MSYRRQRHACCSREPRLSEGLVKHMGCCCLSGREQGVSGVCGVEWTGPEVFQVVLTKWDFILGPLRNHECHAKK